MNSENLDNKKIIMINKDLSKLEPIITLSNKIEKIENEIIGYKDILENENDEELRDIAKLELPIFEKDLETLKKVGASEYEMIASFRKALYMPCPEFDEKDKEEVKHYIFSGNVKE